jgi:hypothetical protein
VPGVSERGAVEQARQLDHGWAGPEHFLLALLAEPNVASETLNALGVTHDLLRERLRLRGADPDLPDARTGIVINPAGHRLVGWARGFAAAQGSRTPRPEHWLVALLYSDERAAMSLHPFGVTAQAVSDALAGRGLPVPGFAPAEHRPWRGVHHVWVADEERRPVVHVLLERHPPGSEWRWGFNWVGEPRRCRISAEDGVDLDGIVAEVREQHG